MADAMAFWTVLLPPNGKIVEQEVESTPNVLTSIHLTGLSLGQNAKEGPHTVTLEYNGTKPVLCTLEAPHTRQWRLDTAIDQTFRLQNWGDSEVHAYGYQVTTAVPMDEDETDEDEEDDELEGEPDEADEEGFRKALRKMKQLNAGRIKAAGPRKGDAMDVDTDEDEDEDEEDDEEEDESEDEEGEDGIPALGELGSDDIIGVADEDEDEDEEDDEEERLPVKVGGKRPPRTPQPEKPRKQLKQEPPKSAPPKQLQQKQKPGPKAIPVQEDGTKQNVKVDKAAAPQPGKPEAPKSGKPAPEAATKAKAEANGKPAEKGKAEEKGKPTEKGKAEDKGKPAGKGKAEEKGKPAEKGKPSPNAKAEGKAKGKPEDKVAEKGGGKAATGDKAKAEQSKGKDKEDKKTSSPKTGKKEVLTPSNEAEYKSAIETFITSQGGSVIMSQLGANVKKPDNVANKLAAFLKKHADTFSVEGDKVTLAKK
ncbi:hypothetical protein Vafri_5683 [Volvox africanus]|nr:hypothetical protein Vafri_5683 [Volvox africanus]